MNEINSSSNTSTSDSVTRNLLTYVLVIISIVGVVVLSIVAIAVSSPKQKLETVKYVLSVVLPMLATWVGTVLAYYFSKENFAAASQSVTAMATRLSGMEKLKSVALKEKMRPLANIRYWPMKAGEEDKCKLSELLSKFDNLDRIPMLDDKARVLYLVYKSVINQFLAQVALNPNSNNDQQPSALTFQNLLDSDSKLKNMFQQSYGFVAETGTLGDAKQVMDAVSRVSTCNDVFVTATGKADESIIGWITDNVIAENAKV